MIFDTFSRSASHLMYDTPTDITHISQYNLLFDRELEHFQAAVSKYIQEYGLSDHG